MSQSKDKDVNPIFSPLNLLYTAWSDQQPTVNQVITENYHTLEQYLSSLTPKDQHSVYQAICRVYSEKERQAFFEGFRTGARLMAELCDQ